MRQFDPNKSFQNGGFHSMPPADAWSSDPDEFQELTKYLAALRQRWPLLLVCCFLAASFSILRYTLTTKEYQATTTIQIERKRLSLVALGQAGWLEDWWNVEYYPTQYRLLRSRGMAERVVMNLRLFEDPAFTGRPAQLLPDPNSSATTRARQDEAELARLASRLQGGLSVNPIKETQLVEISFRSSSPELAANIANGYAEAFIQWGIQTRTETVRGASGFLSAQIDTLRREIEERQQQLTAYTYDSNIALDPAGEALLERRTTLEEQSNKVALERISKEASYREIFNQDNETLANTISNGRVTQLRDELVQLENEYKTKLQTYRPEWPDMVELQRKIDDKRDQLDRFIKGTVKEARETAYAAFQKALREQEGLEEELRKLADESRQLNSTALEYNNLLTNIDTRKELLAELLKRQSETDVASRLQNQQESNVRVVDLAVVPGRPFRPALRSDLIRSLLLGFALGLGGIFILEYLDRTVKTPDELEGIVHLPTLAVIPDIDEKKRRTRIGRRGGGRSYIYGYGYNQIRDSEKGGWREKLTGRIKNPVDRGEKKNTIELLPHHSPRLAISEAYRSLRTALLLSSADELRVIALTSAEPGEGKTATTINLGVVLAQLGRRILIIDGDLRRPRMHKVLKTSNRLGLVNYLTGQADIDQVCSQTEVPNLSICTSGPIPPNPSELLATDRMQAFLEAACSRYHMVLIDTPPALPVTDALILGSMADGVVLCTRAGSLVREDARACRERLDYAELRLLGTVLNRYRDSPGSYSKRYRYYGDYSQPKTPEKTHSAA